MSRLPIWLRPRNVAFPVAALLAYNGARILDDSPKLAKNNLANFDESALWLGLALLALLVAAWPQRMPTFTPRAWPRSALDFWRGHWVEIALFTAIFAFGVFMRVYRFNGTLPSPEGLCCEEHINGGVAYKTLLGDRPLNFLITRWGAAAGFFLFGENTLGLRFFFPVMSIATLVTFYFLLRRLVSVPVASFGFALFAAAWWPSLRARQATEGTIYAVFFALALIVALRTKRPVWAMAAGILAGLLSYEYEPFKAVPIIATAFLVCAAAREVLLREPIGLEAAKERAREIFSIAWRPVLVGLMATGVVLVPMIVGTHKGYDLYLTSVHRQEAGREGDRIADNWRTQLKWAVQVFVPVGPNDYVASPPRDVAGTDLIDPVAAWLALAGLVTSLVLLLRGVRALFVMWVLITLGVAAALLGTFGPWKFVVLVPVVITLAALFVEDARGVIQRRWKSAGLGVLYGALIVAAAFSMWWNADTLFNDVGPSDVIQASYGGEASLLYSVCHELKQGDDSYAFAASETASLSRSLASPRGSEDAESKAWGDLVWACHGLRGQAAAAPEELWPLRDIPGGPITIVATDPPSIEGLAALLTRVYPQLPIATVKHGPGGRYQYVMYRSPDGSAFAQQGLWGTYSAPPQKGPGVAGLPQPVSRLDDVSSLSWETAPSPIAPPFIVTWRGLVYVDEAMPAALTATTDLPVEVRLNGQRVFQQSGGAQTVTPTLLVAGWQVIEISATNATGGGTLSLAWERQDGSREPLSSEDLFPLTALQGWVQTRTVDLPGGQQPETAQRFDIAPHYVSAETIVLLATRPDFEPMLAEERWRGVWQVDDAGEYTLRVDFRSGQTTLFVDGQAATESQEFDQNTGSIQATLALQPGPHAIEIVQTLSTQTQRAGAVITALNHGEPVTMLVTPY